MPKETLELSTYDYEFTDTFGGEANYCWVKRGTVQALSFKQALRKAKKELGLQGIRGITDDYGDSISFKPIGTCTILFIN